MRRRAPEAGFDRLPVRSPRVARVRRRWGAGDPQGRDALFPPGAGMSGAELAQQAPLPFSATVTCRSCGRTTAMTLGHAVRQAVPGVHLPGVGLSEVHRGRIRVPRLRVAGFRVPRVELPGVRFPRVSVSSWTSFIRCPACGQLSWVRLQVNLARI